MGEQSATFAAWVAGKMSAAGMKTLLNGQLRYLEDCKTNVGYYDLMYLDDYPGNLLSDDLGGSGHYVHGDFHAFVKPPNRETVLKFIELIPAILEELATLDFPSPPDIAAIEEDIKNS